LNLKIEGYLNRTDFTVTIAVRNVYVIQFKAMLLNFYTVY